MCIVAIVFLQVASTLGENSPIGLFEKYIFSDWDFLISLAVLVVIDTLTGVLYSLKTKNFNSHRMGDIIYKIILYPFALVTVHVVSSHRVGGEANFLLTHIVPYFNTVCYLFFVLRELTSIAENMAKMGFRVLPAFMMRYFSEFDEQGKFMPREETTATVISSSTTRTSNGDEVRSETAVTAQAPVIVQHSKDTNTGVSHVDGPSPEVP